MSTLWNTWATSDCTGELSQCTLRNTETIRDISVSIGPLPEAPQYAENKGLLSYSHLPIYYYFPMAEAK